MATSAEREKQIKYCLDNYANVAKYVYNATLAYYNTKYTGNNETDAALLGNMYKLMCVNALWADSYIKCNAKKKNENDKNDKDGKDNEYVLLSDFEKMVNEDGSKITEKDIAAFKTIESEANKYSKRISKIFNGIFSTKKIVKVYNDWMKSKFSESLVIPFVQAHPRITLVLKEMEKKVNFSDADKAKLVASEKGKDSLVTLATKISMSISEDEKIQSIYQRVLATDDLTITNPSELNENIKTMYEITKSVVPNP